MLSYLLKVDPICCLVWLARVVDFYRGVSTDRKSSFHIRANMFDSQILCCRKQRCFPCVLEFLRIVSLVSSSNPSTETTLQDGFRELSHGTRLDRVDRSTSDSSMHEQLSPSRPLAIGSLVSSLLSILPLTTRESNHQLNVSRQTFGLVTILRLIETLVAGLFNLRFGRA